MAKLIEFEDYNLSTKATNKRVINIDQIVEVTDLVSYDIKPLTRIKLVTLDFLDIRKSVADIIKIVND